MVNTDDTYGSGVFDSGSYDSSDMANGGEQVSTAIYLNQQIAQTQEQITQKANPVILQPNTAPSNPSVGDMWIDTGHYPNVLYSWDGTKWNAATPTSASDVGAYSKGEVDNALGNKENDISKSPTAPVNPANGSLWLDTSTNPNVLKYWDGAFWDKASPTLASEVGAYSTSQVDTALGNKQNTIPIQATAPASPTTGMLWMDSSVTPNILKNWSGSAWIKASPTVASEVGAESKITKQTTAPSSPVSGQLWIDTSITPNQLKQYSGTAWVKCTPSNPSEVGAEGSIYKQSTAPSSPVVNQLWVDTSITPNVLKLWSGSAWVKASPTVAGDIGAYTTGQVDTALSGKESSIPKQTTAPASPVTGQLWIDTSLTPHILKQYSGSAWVKCTPTTSQEVGAEGLVFKQTTAPNNPVINQLWIDTSTVPNVLKLWSGTAWIKASPTLASDIGAYSTTQVDTALSGKQNAIVYQPATPPTNPKVGDMWIDTNITPNVIYSWDGANWNRASVINAGEVGTYDTATIDSNIGTVQSNLDVTNTTVSTLSSTLADGDGLATTVTNSTVYQTDRDGAISDNQTDLLGSTKMGDENWVNNNLPTMVTTSILEEKSGEIDAKFGTASGVNILQNSVGYAGLLHWQIMSGTPSQYTGADAGSAGSGFQMTSGVMTQVVSVIPNTPYTLTAKVKKGTGGSAYIKLNDGNTFKELDLIVSQAYNFDVVQINPITNGWIPQTDTLIVEIGATDTANAIFTEIMLNEGTTGLSWSNHYGEVYNSSVSMDINGIEVQSNQYDGYTVMSPSEFSGYYRNTQGTMQQVFTLNKDTTQVAKLSVNDATAPEIDMGSLKLLYINGGGSTGWAFIQNV